MKKEEVTKKMSEMKERESCTWSALFEKLDRLGCSVSRGTYENWAWGRCGITTRALVTSFNKAYEEIMND